VQPARVEVAGDEIGDDLRTLAVINGDFLVEVVEQVSGLVGTGTHRQNRQPSLEGAAAQIHDARVGQGIAGQQQAGQGYAVDRGQADGEDDVVTVAGGHHQHAGLEQLYGVTHSAGANDDLGHAPSFVVAGVEDLRAHQVGYVAGARRVEFRLVRDAAQQAEVTAAQQRRMFFQARRESFHAFVGTHFVKDYAKYLRVFRTAEQLGLQFHAA